MPVPPNGLSDMVLSTPPLYAAKNASLNGQIATMIVCPNRPSKDGRMRKDRSRGPVYLSRPMARTPEDSPTEISGGQRMKLIIRKMILQAHREHGGIIQQTSRMLLCQRVGRRKERRRRRRKIGGPGQRMRTLSQSRVTGRSRRRRRTGLQ